MKNIMAGTLADAWAMWKADRDLLTRLAGLLLFLPSFAILLLVPRMPPLVIDPNATEAAQRVVAEAVASWMMKYGGWPLLASILVQFAALALQLLYLRADRPDLGTALGRAMRLFPRYLPAMILVGVPLGAAQFSLLFFLPGLYLFGRMMLTGPVLVVDPKPSIRRAVARSWALTHGHGLAAAGLAGLAVFGGGTLASLFLAVDRGLNAAQLANPVALALVDAAAAAMMAATMLALALFQVALYRRLASGPVSNRGI
ncbi:MAG: hypothetical protein V4564_16495 [Pseudomonadota bacterium]|uniref:hypothetical protein n=1 Tax=Sphingomonas sp. ERG5 TaxID=1381597 RepID=UPI00054C397E|nr:hypothetical protein [Sphingomonas sp. ERG5]